LARGALVRGLGAVRGRSPQPFRAGRGQGNEGKEPAQIRCESRFRCGRWWTGDAKRPG